MGETVVRPYPASRDISRVCHTCCAALVVGACLVLMRRSYWLDETATHYFVAGSWSDLWSRLAMHPQMSPGYYVAVKAIGPLWLQGEPGLRWLSLAALGGACLLLHRLGSRLFGGEAALHAAVVFAALPNVARQAVNARPYALGILCIVAATWLLVRWLDEGRAWDAAGLALASAAAVWVHFTMGIMLVVYAAYALQRRRSGAPAIRALLGVAIAISIFIAPLLLRMSLTWRSSASLSFSNPPAFEDLVVVLALPLVVIASIRHLARPEREGDLPSVGTSRWVLVLGWAFLPPVALFVIARRTSAQVFVDRYLLVMYPAVALLVGVWLQRFGSAVMRSVLLGVIVVACVTVTLRTPLEDWRGAIEEIRSLELGRATPMFLSAGYIEARDPELLNDPRYEGYLASPLVSYPVEARIVLLPDVTDSQTEAAIQRLVDPELEHSRRVLLLSRGFHPIVEWLRIRVIRGGFTWRELGPYSGIRAALVEREDPGTAHPSPLPP